MGCDIHVFVEGKVKDEWVLLDILDVDRWYSLFGRIAGVRDCCQDPVVYPRGLPNDLSHGTAIHHAMWGDDAHTHGWMDHTLWINVEKEFDIYNLQFSETVYMLDSGKIDGLRVVFWFDN